MNALLEQNIQCPYCWEQFSVLIDTSESHQEYVEDCFVCCRPIRMVVICNDSSVEIEATMENE